MTDHEQTAVDTETPRNPSPKNHIWSSIVDELATLQDGPSEGFERPLFNPYDDERVGMVRRTDEQVRGAVQNPVCGFPTTFDTACAARVFATEFRRTGETRWRRRGERALESIRSQAPHGGVPEPRWDPVGWHFAEGSLFTTGVVLECYWETASILGETDQIEPSAWDDLGVYLESCRHGRGKYAHNAVPDGARAGDVQNTTAFALFLRSYAARHGTAIDSILGDAVTDASEHLADGQRTDGFWPYIYPTRFQQWLFRHPSIHPLVRTRLARKTLFRGDSWVFMGDSVHHCYVLYYLLRTAELTDGIVSGDTLEAGWRWIKHHLVPTEDGYHFDFSWEPGPETIRFCNFYDTSTYFFVLALLPLLNRVGVIQEPQVADIAEGILRYIDSVLLDSSLTPCLSAHECPYEVRRRILPAVWGGSTLKGALLARLMDADIL